MGLCALSVALLFGGFGEPVAVADTEPGDAVSDTVQAGDQGEDLGTTETEPTGGTPGTGVVGTLPELLGIFGTDPQPPSDHGEAPAESGGLTGPMALGGLIDAQPAAAPAVPTDNTGTDSSPAATSQESTQPQTVVSHTPESSSDSQTSNVDAASLTNAEVNSLTNGEANSLTNTEVNPPAGNPPAEEPAVVQPATNAVVLVESPASAPSPPAVLPAVGAAQADDVVKALAYFFIALTPDGVPYFQIPNNLLSLLGIPPISEAATASLTAGGIGGSLLAGGLYNTARIQLASSLSVPAGWPGMLIAPGDSAALASARAAADPTPEGVGASGAVERHPVGIKAVLAGGILPEQVRSVLQHTVDAVLAPFSVLALAALASPGLVGLLLLSAAGMFFGYRQARAASMLRAVGIARFVKAGPLGVVRSGGLVSLHTRPSSVRRPDTHRASGVLETVA